MGKLFIYVEREREREGKAFNLIAIINILCRIKATAKKGIEEGFE